MQRDRMSLRDVSNFLNGFNIVQFDNVERDRCELSSTQKLSHVFQSLVRLTETQSSCRAWFILRAFKFTSRTSGGYLRALRSM